MTCWDFLLWFRLVSKGARQKDVSGSIVTLEKVRIVWNHKMRFGTYNYDNYEQENGAILVVWVLFNERSKASIMVSLYFIKDLTGHWKDTRHLRHTNRQTQENGLAAKTTRPSKVQSMKSFGIWTKLTWLKFWMILQMIYISLEQTIKDRN